MKTLIAGSRSIVLMEHLIEAIKESKFKISSVVSGGARGVDRLGERLASEFNIPVYLFPANWERHGKRAGFIRNEELVAACEQAIILWNGMSKGTTHTIHLLERYKIPYHIKEIKDE